MPKANNRLGKGLDSLIPTSAEEIDEFAASSTPKELKVKNNVIQIKISSIEPNPHQPRKEFDARELSQLTDSIKKYGILQPIIVSAENDWQYQLIAGERRWRAAKEAGLETVPAIVRSLDEQAKLEVALIENIQRSDLTPIEKAAAYSKLVDQFNLTHATIGESVGKATSTVTNTIRLLNLTKKTKQALSDNKITEGHCRAILALTDSEKQDQFTDYIIKNNLTVRAAEDLVREFKGGVEIKKTKVREARASQTRITNELSRYLGTKVNLMRTAKGGKLQIEYYSEEELNRIYQQILGQEPSL